MRQFWTLVAAVALVGGVSEARAGVVTFSFGDSDDGLSTISKTVDGITLTLSNPGAYSVFFVDGDGIFLSSNPNDGQNTSFDLAVTGGTIQLTGYQVGFTYVPGASAQFGMSGGSGTSTGNSMSTGGTFTANGNWQLAPGQVGTLTPQSFAAATAYSQLKSLSFNVVPAAAVPEPGTVGLALVGAGVLGVRAWRRRGRRAAA